MCLGHSNWTICSPLSQFCSDNFPNFRLLSWGANSYYPRRPIMRNGIHLTIESFSNSAFATAERHSCLTQWTSGTSASSLPSQPPSSTSPSSTYLRCGGGGTLKSQLYELGSTPASSTRILNWEGDLHRMLSS